MKNIDLAIKKHGFEPENGSWAPPGQKVHQNDLHRSLSVRVSAGPRNLGFEPQNGSWAPPGPKVHQNDLRRSLSVRISAGNHYIPNILDVPVIYIALGFVKSSCLGSHARVILVSRR